MKEIVINPRFNPILSIYDTKHPKGLGGEAFVKFIQIKWRISTHATFSSV